jgi:uncharacterized protein (DUF58 family)
MANNQFDQQTKVLMDNERELSIGKEFLSSNEWSVIEKALNRFAKFTKSRFDVAIRGDSLASLAVRKNAYNVAILLLDSGVDPFIENEENEDLFQVLQKSYANLSSHLRELHEKRQEASSRVALPSEMEVCFILLVVYIIVIEVFCAILSYLTPVKSQSALN